MIHAIRQIFHIDYTRMANVQTSAMKIDSERNVTLLPCNIYVV